MGLVCALILLLKSRHHQSSVSNLNINVKYVKQTCWLNTLSPHNPSRFSFSHRGIVLDFGRVACRTRPRWIWWPPTWPLWSARSLAPGWSPMQAPGTSGRMGCDDWRRQTRVRKGVSLERFWFLENDDKCRKFVICSVPSHGIILQS